MGLDCIRMYKIVVKKYDPKKILDHDFTQFQLELLHLQNLKIYLIKKYNKKFEFQRQRFKKNCF